MTNSWVIYRIDNGEILPRQYVGTNITAQLRAGEAAIPGVASWRTHRVDRGALVALTEPRTAPDSFAMWRHDIGSWVDERTQQQRVSDQWAVARKKRDELLASTDWIAIKQAEQGGPVALEWRTYRQALRDITLQADPFSLTWPTPP